MMPHPVRQDEALGVGFPILRMNRYAVEQIDLADAVLQNGAARLVVAEVLLRNNSGFRGSRFRGSSCSRYAALGKR